MKGLIKTKILQNYEISPGIYEMILMSKELARGGFPGKFVNIYFQDSLYLMPRPISICEVLLKEEAIKLVYAVVGKGTQKLSMMKTGDEIKVLGPLGNGFSLEKGNKKNIIIGGGLGVPPLLELAKTLRGDTVAYLGFRSEPFLVGDFQKFVPEVYVATEDGCRGFKGNVMDLIERHKPDGDMFYSCGPKPMLQAVVQWAREKDIDGQVSLEEHMACGIGACIVCTCKISEKNDGNWEHKRVCKDGPVFSRDEVVWE